MVNLVVSLLILLTWGKRRITAVVTNKNLTITLTGKVKVKNQIFNLPMKMKVKSKNKSKSAIKISLVGQTDLSWCLNNGDIIYEG